jgi:serine-type D-Ala-D-Ala carboxypeptidase (penicillin-binding protein 5/6)
MKFSTLTVFILLFVAFSQAYAKQKTIYHSAIVYHPDSDKIIINKKATRQRIPASLVKMMLGYIVMSQLEEKKISLDDKYKVTAAASKIGGHQVYLKQGEVFTLRELLKAVIIGSANDAAYAVAEHVAGSEREFVRLMNKQAIKLGMTSTHFVNSHGLPPNWRNRGHDNKTTAYDMAILAKHLIKIPAILKLTSTQIESFRDGKFQLINTNRKFLRAIPGADGLKTGFHSRGAGFNLVGTARQNGERLIVVVMGAERSSDRLRAAKTLIKQGFKKLKIANSQKTSINSLVQLTQD